MVQVLVDSESCFLVFLPSTDEIFLLIIIEIAENTGLYPWAIDKKIITQLSKICKGVIDFFQESTISTNEGQ